MGMEEWESKDKEVERAFEEHLSREWKRHRRGRMYFGGDYGATDTMGELAKVIIKIKEKRIANET